MVLARMRAVNELMCRHVLAVMRAILDYKQVTLCPV